MNVRVLLALVVGGALALPPGAAAQRIPIGYVEFPCLRPGWLEPFVRGDAVRDALQQRQHLHGGDVIYEHGCAVREEDLGQVVSDLLQRGVRVIIAIGDEAARAAGERTATVPIVAVTTMDPPGDPLAPAPANVVAIRLRVAEQGPERLELLRQLAPGASRVAVIWNPEAEGAAHEWARLAATRPPGLVLESLEVRDAEQVQDALATLALSPSTAVLVVLDALTYAQRDRIAAFTAAARIVAVFPLREFARSGGLAAYGPRLDAVPAQVARYVERILQGATPSELPVAGPAGVDLVINLDTAEALGVRVPDALRRRATEVIEETTTGSRRVP